MDAFQETDITGVTLPISKHNYLVSNVEDLAPTLKEAFYIAASGRPGPVLVDIAKNAQNESMDFEWDGTPVRLPGYRPDLRVLPEELERALELIQSSEKPVILAGHGVTMSGALKELRSFAEKAQIPVAMTLLGIGGLPASHPLNLGMMGMHGEAWVNKAIQEADLLLAFGMRFDDRVTGNLKSYAPEARKIHIDIDPSEINKVIKADVGIVGDLRETLQRLLPELPQLQHGSWLDYIDDLKKDSAARDIQNIPDDGHLYAAHVIHDIWRYTQGEAVVVTDVGQNQMWAAQYYLHELPHRLITSGGLGTMGFALPAAIGARFAKPEDEIWVIVGDGGFQMTQSELSTCKQEEIKLNIAIINNGYLGMVRQWQELFYERRYAATQMVNPDFVKLTEAHGLVGLRAQSREEVQDVVAQARETPGTVVIDFQVEQEDSVYPMVPAGADLHNMIRRPAPQHMKIKSDGRRNT
jgi:acetolactate synthase-1/2/3 large subunit